MSLRKREEEKDKGSAKPTCLEAMPRRLGWVSDLGYCSSVTGSQSLRSCSQRSYPFAALERYSGTLMQKTFLETFQIIRRNEEIQIQWLV